MKEFFLKNDADAPLSARLFPRRFEDFAGQRHLLSDGKMLRRVIEADKMSSAIFYGPPGCGKTALAKFIASRSKAEIFEINAALASIAELKKILSYARKSSGSVLDSTRKTLLLLDEIHHFNRSQQDVLLPSVEKGEIVLIGITTENPFYYVNSALLSRFLIFEFKPLSEDDLRKVSGRAVRASEGLGKLNVRIEKDAEDFLIRGASGDARRLLNALEIAAMTTPPQGGKIRITLKDVAESMQRRSLKYDKKSDEHYDHISAFIKSMRGSDPDAAVYWMARMLKSGEDPRFVARRILICASEDVGNANPNALIVAQSAFNAVEVLGMPEARIPLAQAAIYVAVSPKSNACYKAIETAMNEVESGPRRDVPPHLKDANRDSEIFGHGKGYKYPHNYKNHYVKQEYMPEPIKFYEPSSEGFEIKILERMKKLGR